MDQGEGLLAAHRRTGSRHLLHNSPLHHWCRHVRPPTRGLPLRRIPLVPDQRTRRVQASRHPGEFTAEVRVLQHGGVHQHRQVYQPGRILHIQLSTFT